MKHPDPGPQLDLEPVAVDPHSEELLRIAYDRSKAARHGVSFEEAKQDRGLLIALRNVAEGIARTINQHLEALQ